MKAIFTLVNENVNESLIALLSSKKHNDVPHYLFYDEINEDLITQFPQLKFIQIESIVAASEYQKFSKYIDTHHHPALFFMVEYLSQYSAVTYISERVHVTERFDFDKYYNNQLLLAPPIAKPFTKEVASNKFIEAHRISTKTYLSEDLVIINTKRFIDEQILQKFSIFTEDLYNNSEATSNQLSRIPSRYAFNLFIAEGIDYKYLPQNYLLDIEYTANYNDTMVAFYQSHVFDFNIRIDEQIELIDLDITKDVYNLEYLLYVLEFLKSTGLVETKMLEYNEQMIAELILKRNGIYQMRLDQWSY